MSIRVACPSCSFTDDVPDEFAGKRLKCRQCGSPLVFVSQKPSGAEAARSVKTKAAPAASHSDATRKSKLTAGTKTSPKTAPPSSLALIAGWGIAVALLLAFGLTVGLVVYFSVKPTEQARNQGVASDSQAEHSQPSRLFDERRLDPKASEHRQPFAGGVGLNRGENEKKGGSPQTRPGREEADLPTDTPAGGPAETLASVDRLNIALPPLAPDEAPTPVVWEGHTASIRGVAFTDDGRFVVSVSGAIQKIGAHTDNSIRVWDARRGKQLRKLDDFREALNAVSVSPGGRFAVFGHGGHYEGGVFVNAVDHEVRLWDIQENREFYFRKGVGNGEQSEARFRGLDSSVFSTAFSPDRNKVVGVANSGKLIVWDSESGKSLVTKKVIAVPRQREDEGLLAPISFTLNGINCIRFTPDGRWLLAGGGDYTVRLFDAATGEELHIFEDHQDIVWAVAVTRTKDGRLLGLSGAGSRQRLKGDGFVPGARDYAIRLWDLDARKVIRRFVGHEGEVMSLAFRPGGRHFLSAGMDETVRLWEIASGKLLRTYRGHTDNIRSVAVSPDGRSAVSGGDDCTIRYWRLPATAEDVILALDKRSRTDLTAAMNDLDKMGPELRAAYPKLVQTLCQDNKEMAELALTILRQLGPPEKEWVNGLRELLASSLPAARLFAAEELAQLGTDALPALAELRKTLRDVDPAVRSKTVAALTNLGTNARAAADDLKQLFQQANDPALLVAVMDAFAAIGIRDQNMVDQLLASKGLQHTDAAVRSKALECLWLWSPEVLRIKNLAELYLEDANPQVRKRAHQVLKERMKRLSDVDKKEVRSLLEMTDKPEAVQIGLEAVRHWGPKAKELLPDLLKRLSVAKGEHKLEIALTLAAIDARDTKVAKSIIPVLIAGLRPETEADQPRQEILKAIATIGEPVVDEIFEALEAAEGTGNVKANYRKALFLALERLGREAYSERNIRILSEYRRKERYPDVQAAATKAMKVMLPP